MRVKITKRRTEAVVLAADGLARAGVAWNTDNADGAASDANRDVDVLNNDAQQTKDCGKARVASLLDVVAALDGPGAAGRCRGRSSDDSGGKSQSSEELELHDDDEACEAC